MVILQVYSSSHPIDNAVGGVSLMSRDPKTVRLAFWARQGEGEDLRFLHEEDLTGASVLFHMNDDETMIELSGYCPVSQGSDLFALKKYNLGGRLER